MTKRGKSLFDRYVSTHLDHPALVTLTMGQHAFNLTLSADDAHIPSSEMTDEVGPLVAALDLARLTKFPTLGAIVPTT